MRPGALLLALLLTSPQVRAESRIFRAKALRIDIDALVDSAKKSLEIRLVRFDDPLLQDGALKALSRGAKVRVILARQQAGNRRAAEGLRKQGLRLRWSGKGDEDYLIADGKRVIFGPFDGSAASLDEREESAGSLDDAALAADFTREFEKDWKRLPSELPEGLTLRDELESLPDPRENAPHLRIKRRKN